MSIINRHEFPCNRLDTCLILVVDLFFCFFSQLRACCLDNEPQIFYLFQGCKPAIITFVDDNLLYVGIAAGVIVILQVIIFSKRLA